MYSLKKYYIKYFIATLILVSFPRVVFAQSLDVAGKIKGFYDETIVPAFPWAVLLVFLGVGIGNFSLFVGENADIKKGLYRMFLYPLIVMIFGIIVDFLKNYRI